ncbi:hypothetical protein MYX82_12410 [Acidobacteria bacterium AH-259-D05]|nr:hypothetical protein [Acidobacteria bacterium AH-259-D05]
MGYLSLETSAVNRASEQGISPESLLKLIQSHGGIPAVGLHVLYEIDRNFLHDELIETGVRLSSFLYDLEPNFIKPVDLLLEEEIIRLRTNAEVRAIMDPHNQASAMMELYRLTTGNTEEAREFVSRRENAVRLEVPQEVHAYLRHVNEVRNQDPQLAKTLKSFEDVFQYAESEGQLPRLVTDILQGVRISVNSHEAKELSLRLPSFPALHSLVRANIYICFIQIVERVQPARDRLDDFRHFIESSYSETMLTEDGGILRRAPDIAPNLLVKSLDDIAR